jgi:hypothetical protein
MLSSKCPYGTTKSKKYRNELPYTKRRAFWQSGANRKGLREISGIKITQTDKIIKTDKTQSKI